MNRILSIAAILVCLAGTAEAARKGSSQMNWGDGQEMNCMEPFAPSVPKPDETTLEEMLEEVQPEVRTFIEESKKYLSCVDIKIAKAREERDQDTLGKLVKQFNDNVEYQKEVAEEYNAAVTELKRRADLAAAKSVAQPAGADAEGSKPADGEKPQDGAESQDGAPSQGDGTQPQEDAPGQE